MFVTPKELYVYNTRNAKTELRWEFNISVGKTIFNTNEIN